MTLPSVSVVVVSRGRAAHLRLCLMGLEQLYHPKFEVVVVADPQGAAEVEAMGLGDQIKLVRFDQPNISAARNLGIAQAGGEVVAFLDDDAVPEPTWLGRLVAPFADPKVMAATGYVRGRNGISFQWRAAEIGRDGVDTPLTVPDQGVVLAPRESFAVKTVGTNAAFRRAALAKIGGFDEAFRFFHDETDVNMRLASEGALTAIVPMAQVHHGFAESDRRGADRVPKDLTEIAASTALFHRKHGSGSAEACLARLEAEQTKRLEAHMVSGALEPRDLGRLLAGLRSGFADGMARDLEQGGAIEAADFVPWDRGSIPTEHVFLGGPSSQSARILGEAQAGREGGKVVSVCLLRPSPAFHRVGFDSRGIWLQNGGLWGKSGRDDPLIKGWSLAARLTAEEARIAPVRNPNQ